MTEPLTDSEKLLLLARWFDLWDERDDVRRRAILDDQNFPGKNDVQADLRRIATTLDARAAAPLDVERLAEAIHRQLQSIGYDRAGCSDGGSHLTTADTIAAEYAALIAESREEGT